MAKKREKNIVDSLTYKENYVLVYEVDDYNQQERKYKGVKEPFWCW